VPADGDSVIAVGGVLPDSTRYPTSSVGPTAGANPRIKPDVMALGGAVWIAATGSVTHFAQSAGTSFACPLAAGVAALLLQAQPNATPIQIRDAMRSTATRAATPDNLYGWGIVDAPAALAYLTTAVQPAAWTDVKGMFR
jgi:subtilisin family serine protease